MSIRSTFAVVAILATITAAGCGGESPAAPSAMSADASASISAPQSVAPQSVRSGPTGIGTVGCPANPPFHAAADIIVAGGGTGFRVTAIDATFVDQRGMSTAQVTLTAPVPTVQIGSALADAKRFPVDVGFGCGTGRNGTIVVIVHTVDGRGRTGSRQLSIDVG